MLFGIVRGVRCLSRHEGLTYDSEHGLLADLDQKIIAPTEAKAKEQAGA
jgi:hypothetical protein